jgi:small-conductance mechanosensitive channel
MICSLLFFDLFRNSFLLLCAIAVAVAASGILVAKIGSFIIGKIIKPIVKRTKTDIDDKLAEILNSAIFKILIVAGFYIALEILKNSFGIIPAKDYTRLIDTYPLFHGIIKFLNSTLYVVIVLVVLLMFFRATAIFFDWYEGKVTQSEDRKLSSHLFVLLKKLTKFILFALALVITLEHFGINISGLLVSLGVGSLAIALAAQDTLSNMIAGFIILVDRPFRIGDRIKLSTGETGDIFEVGFRSTRIQDFDGNLVIIPNAEIIKSRLVNLTFPVRKTKVYIDVGVAYGADVNEVKSLLKETALKNTLIDHQADVDVSLITLGDSALIFRILCQTEDYTNIFKIKCQLNEAVYSALNAKGIEIPFPQSVIHLKKEEN